MYTEEERVLKEWEDKVHMDTPLNDTLNDVADITFTRDDHDHDITLTQTLTEPNAQTDRSSRNINFVDADPLNSTRSRSNTRELIHVDKFLKDDNVFDTSAESLDEERKRGLYTECNSTGSKVFRISYDMQVFKLILFLNNKAEYFINTTCIISHVHLNIK